MASERIEIVSESDVEAIKERQVKRDSRAASLPEPVKRPVIEIPRRPLWISHSYPPTEEELKALYIVGKRRCIGQIHSADVVKGRLVLLVEWVGHYPLPDVLAYRKPKPKEPKYSRLG